LSLLLTGVAAGPVSLVVRLRKAREASRYDQE
jgi:hypothetical protein